MPHHPVYLWTLPMFHCNGWCFPWAITAQAGTHVCLRRVEAEAVLHALEPTAIDHCLAAHASAEQAHREALRRLALDPLLDLRMRLGEGSGAALAMGVVKAAVACVRDMATFDQAGVAGPVPAG